MNVDASCYFSATFSMLKLYESSISLMLLLLIVWKTTSCPTTCICKWKGGKEWVECTARGLHGLPQGAREETQVLDLSGNQLHSLPADCFFVLRLINLQRLFLGRSRICRLSERSFTGLQGLVELDLSDNELEQVPSETFASVGNLMRLTLAGNPLRTLHSNAFRYLGQLNILDLSRCSFSQLEPAAFAGLHALEWLRLNDNLLTVLPQTALPPTANLLGLFLHGNPWLCDCQMTALHEWLRESQASIPQEAEPFCEKPERLQTRLLRTLKVQELACRPKIYVAERLVIHEGENVTLQCEVQATPQSNIVWLFNGEILDLEYSAIKKDRVRCV